MSGCALSHICSGCSLIQTPRRVQLELKQARLQALCKRHGLSLDRLSMPISWLELPAWGLRDRLDFVLTSDPEKGSTRLGLFDVFRTSLVDIPGCPQLSEPLEKWLQSFREQMPRVQRGSVRLRVSPWGLRGVWYDFANTDIRDLLIEQRHLVSLLSDGVVVEMGQRRRRTVLEKNTAKFSNPGDEDWFATFNAHGHLIPLGSSIGAFSQPSLAANRVLIKWYHEQLNEILGPREASVLEFGAGTGNLTLATLSHPHYAVHSLELDRSSSESLERNVARAGWQDRLSVSVGNFHRAESRPSDSFDLFVLDPPRSGLGDFIPPSPEEAMPLPDAIISISCYPESWCLDSARWARLGYSIDRIQLLDQFPQSDHFEVLSVLRKLGPREP